MTALAQTDLLRVRANSELDPKSKASLGQFFTDSPICLFMTSLFNNIGNNVQLLDPGCGPGSLTASFIDETIRRSNTHSLIFDAYDIEDRISPYITETIELCSKVADENVLMLEGRFNQSDFILTSDKKEQYTHVVMNPPYKKISSKSEHRQALRSAGIETVNLYTGFVALAIKKLKQGGELVAIIPRSFCNGLYYRDFRKMILEETSIEHIHIFDSRTNAFSDDNVLQENIIIHLIKGKKQGNVTITSSPTADFQHDKETGVITATDQTSRMVAFNKIVKHGDPQSFFHIVANERDQFIVDKLECFNTTLDDLGIKVSTGPVVGFRLKDDLRKNIEPGSVPLIYPVHLKNGFLWPRESRKDNAIAITDKSSRWLWKNKGYFLFVNRFSAKEEQRRIVATVYDGSLDSELIGFDNKLNVFHLNKEGFDRDLARGLYIYLNSTLLDKYYRLFGGHTQVNATDLRTIHYPEKSTLISMGKKLNSDSVSQVHIDTILAQEIKKMTGSDYNPLLIQEKIDQAIQVILDLGLPKEQQNERSALTLLALLNLKPEDKWEDIEMPMLGVTPIMEWCEKYYGKSYAPNSRETFRRFTLHQFVDGGLCLYNPDQPDRPVNSPKACYQVTNDLLECLKNYHGAWEESLANWLENRQTLREQYAMVRENNMVPLLLPNGTTVKLSPGIHSELIRDIVESFGPTHAPGAEVIYLGDTGAKEDFFEKDRLAELGVTVDRKGKMPDVVLYWEKKDWLLLIESVTSHGPVDGKRHGELSELFKNASPGLVFVTAFPDRKTMGKYLSVISWETEVWTADAETHLIHFNGDRFLGPH